MSYFDQLLAQAEANDKKNGATGATASVATAQKTTGAQSTDTYFDQLMRQAEQNDTERAHSAALATERADELDKMNTPSASRQAAAQQPATAAPTTTDDKFSLGKLLTGGVRRGVTQAGTAISSTLSWLESALFAPLEAITGYDDLQELHGVAYKLNEQTHRERDTVREQYAANTAKGGKAAQIAEDVIAGTTAAIPQAITAFMSSGTSLGVAGAQGLEATALAAQQSPTLLNSLRSAIVGMANDPNYWTSFLQAAGNSYEEAKADGADDSRASLYALSNGLFNAAIEVGGGLETLPGELRGGRATFLRWLQSAKEEGSEEVWQGIVERGLQNLIYGKKNPIASLTDENAVLNPITSAKEFGMGAAIGGILGGGQMALAGALNAAAGQNTTNPTNTQAQQQSAQNTPPVAAGARQNVAEGNLTPAQIAALTGQKTGNTATERTTNENGLVALTMQERINLASGKRNKVISTFSDAVDFIRNALTNRQSTDRAYMGKITDATAAKVLTETGVDVKGYNAILPSDNVRHIMKNHGDAQSEAARGQIAVAPEDIALIPEVLAAPDAIRLSSETDSRGRPVLVFEKQIGDNFVTMQAVADGTHSLQTDTLYKQKRKNPQGTEYYNAGEITDPAHNVRNVPPQGSFNFEPTIPQPSNVVKGVEGSTRGDVNTEQRGDFGNATGAAQQGFSVSHGEQVPTQNRTVTDSRYMTTDEQERLAPQSHERVTEGMSIERAAQQFYADENGNVTNLDDTVDGLLSKDAWTGADEDAAQVAQAYLVAEARRTGDWRKVQELGRAIEETGGTGAGRALQARQKWIKSKAGTISRAAQTLLSAPEGTDVNRVMQEISELADELERARALPELPPHDGGDGSAQQSRADALADVIRRTSRIRRTGNFFTNRWSQTMENALNHVVEQARAGDESALEFLESHAGNGLVAIAQDFTPVGAATGLLTIRRNAMLSKVSTTLRNFISNNVFDPIDSVSRDISAAIDTALSHATGTRSVAADYSWFSAAKRRGAMEGLERSILEVGLDVDASGERSRYENGARRTFSMQGGTFSRLLSTWEKHLGYRLYSTDQFQKGGIDAEVQRGIDRLYERNLITRQNADGQRVVDESLRDAGATEALYRTFQDSTMLSRAVLGATSPAERCSSRRYSAQRTTAR